MEHLIDRALGVLRCPNCHALKKFEHNRLGHMIHCGVCHVAYSYGAGFLDFMPDFTPSDGLAQRFMENKYVVDVYERYFRPAFTALGSPIKYHEEEAWLKAIDSPRPVKTVLDLAAGTGRYARMLADLHQPEIVFAADISEPMIRKGVEICAAKGYSNILYMRADAHHLPFSDASIDRINCFGALHLFPDPPQAIKELGRVGAEQAIFSCLAACEYHSGWQKPLQALFTRFATFTFFAVDDLNKYLQSAHFSSMKPLQKEMLLMFEATREVTAP